MNLRAAWTQRFSPLLNQPVSLEGKSGEPLDNQALGDLGERIAVDYLISIGRKVLYRNYRGPYGGELDIVTRDEEVLAFVEVKTRRAGGLGRPLDAIDWKKRQLLRRGGLAWLKLLKNPEITSRYDAVEVILLDGELAQVQLVTNIKTFKDRKALEAS